MIVKIKQILNKQVIIGGIIIACILFGLVLILQVGVFPYLRKNSEQTAKVAITPYSIEDIQNPGIQPTTTQLPESLPGVVALGMTVKVTGTANEGLRMRSGAGTDKTVLNLAVEGETFSIIDGPIIKDSLIWWKIQSMENNQKTGWSVQDYLAEVQQ